MQPFLPSRAGNDYRGHPVALWVLVPVTLATLGRSLVHVFRADGGAQSIATIPLDSYTRGGAEAVVTLFALWGLSQLLLGLVQLVVLWRYRTLIPLVYALLIVEYAGRSLVGVWKPVETIGSAPGAVANLPIVALAVAMLALSLRSAQSSTRSSQFSRHIG